MEKVNSVTSIQKSNLQKTGEYIHDNEHQQINCEKKTDNLNSVPADQNSSEKTTCSQEDNDVGEKKPSNENNNTQEITGNVIMSDVYCNINNTQTIHNSQSIDAQQNSIQEFLTSNSNDNVMIIDVSSNMEDRSAIHIIESTDIQQMNNQEENGADKELTAIDKRDTLSNVTSKSLSDTCSDKSGISAPCFINNPTMQILQVTQDNTDSRDNCIPDKLKHGSGLYFEPEMFKRSKIDLYAEDTGPKLYTVKCNNVTPPLIPTNLPQAFEYLPVYGRPKTKANMKDFLKNKVKEFVGGGLNDEEFEQLSKECCPDKLRTGEELMMPSSVPGTGLLPQHLLQTSDDHEDEPCTVRKHKLRMKMDTKNVYQKKLKYRGVRIIPVIQEEFSTANVDDESQLQPGKDLVFHIRFYRPTPYNPLEKQIKTRHSLFSCDMVVLGRQTLETLRDRIACASDVVMRVDVSHDPDNLPPNSSKDLFPSGFLFINNTFYVDGRAGCADTSRPVREWAARRGIGQFPHSDMDIRLDQLPVKLGHPDVYVHQGNCEHLFTFSDVRLLNASDPLNISQYPYHTSVGQNQTVYCTTCAEFGAKWIVVGSPRVPFSSSFFCDTCFRMYFYKEKEKIGNFKAYAYRGNELNILKPQVQFGAKSVFNFKNSVIQ